jgi:hypothetical protein
VKPGGSHEREACSELSEELARCFKKREKVILNKPELTILNKPVELSVLINLIVPIDQREMISEALCA